MLKSSRVVRTGVGVAALMLSMAASASVIDLFTVEQSAVDSTSNGTPVTSSVTDAGGSIIGNNRDLVVNEISDSFGTGNTSMNIANGFLSFSTSSGVVGTGKVQWDGAADTTSAVDYTGLRNGGATGVDLVNQVGCPTSGCNAFITEVNFTDEFFSYAITLWTDATNYTTLSASVQFLINPALKPGIPAVYLFDFFEQASGNYLSADGLQYSILKVGNGADINNVGAMELTLNSGSPLGNVDAIDLTISAVKKRGVPEPASLALVGLALAGFGLVRVGRNQKIKTQG